MTLPISRELGFFGKLPGVGDFVQRRLPADFVMRWDTHFQRVLAAVQTQSGSQWLRVYDNGPVWRFMLAPGVCGERAWAGVIGPAMDRVGRRFPMVIAAAIDETPGSAAQVLRTQTWFAALEQRHRQGQGATAPGVEAFAEWIAELPAAQLGPDALDASLTTLDWREAEYTALPACPPDGGWLAQLWERLPSQHGADALWWSVGDERIAGGVRLTRGLPGVAAYRSMLGPESDVLAARAVGPEDDPRPHWPPPLPSDPAPPVALPTAVKVADEPTRRASLDHGVRMSVLRRGSVTRSVICADPTPGVQARQGATMACAVIEQAGEQDLVSLGASLLALHPRLRLAREDLIDPIDEDVAVLVLQTEADQATLLRIGKASAWLCRDGELQPLFDATAADETPASARPGLGALAMPGCEQVSCRLRAGDRLLLLTGHPLTALPRGYLAEALALPSVQASCRQLALWAGLPAEAAPLRLIEIAA